jgi:hypothetical protein
VIDWLNCRGNLQVISLVGWKDIIKELTTSFSTLRFAHIFREQIWEVDAFSKKALRAPKGKIMYNKWIEGHDGPPLILHLF